MKHLRALGLAALMIAVAAMTALAGSAGADYVTTTTGGGPDTQTLHLINEGGHVTLKSGSIEISCASTLEGTVTEHLTGLPIITHINEWNLTGCTNFWHVTTETPGLLAINSTSGHNGTVTSTGTKVRLTRLGVNCVYETNNTHIGTVTGGSPATLHINVSTPIIASESAEVCGTTSTWVGKYVTTSALYVVAA